MKCPYCGHENKNKAKKCRSCGKSLRVAREARRVYAFGTVLIILILVAGGVALRIASRGLIGSVFGSGSQMLEAVAQRTETVKEDVTADVKVEESAGTIGGDNSEEELPEVALAAELTDDKSIIDLQGYAPLKVASADASSVLPSKKGGNAYAAASAVDGEETTSWQEGEEGDGVGSTLTLHLDHASTIRYILVKLGNWRSDGAYADNGRPQTLTFTFGEESVQVSFPDEKKEHCITLSKDVTAQDITVRLDAVYAGGKHSDTCIAELSPQGY